MLYLEIWRGLSAGRMYLDKSGQVLITVEEVLESLKRNGRVLALPKILSEDLL